MNINEENPGTPTDTIDPNTPTASLYVELKTLRRMPQEYAYLMEDSNLLTPKYGKIWLVGEATDITHHIGNPFSSFRYSVPNDSNYFDNTYDLFNLFENGTFSALRTIENPHGRFTNIPYGKYRIVGCMGVPHDGIIKAYMVSVGFTTIDSTSDEKTVVLNIFGYLPHAEPYIFSN